MAFKVGHKELALLDAIPSVITITTPDGEIVYASPLMLETFGYRSLADIGGLNAIHHWDDPKDREEIIKLVQTGGAKGFKARFRRKDGTIFWASVNASIRDFQGQSLFFASFTDITDQKIAENSARDYQEQYRVLFEESQLAIWLVDFETTKIIDFNTRAHESLGYTREEFENLDLSQIDPFISQKEVMAHQKRIKQSQITFFETRHQTKTGEILNILVDMKMVSINGKVMNQVFCHDITEHKKIAKELEDYRDHLEKLVKTRTIDLEEVNTALRVLLEEINQEKSKLKSEMLFNIRQMVLPYIRKLRKLDLDKKQKNLMDIIESNLTDILLPIAHNMPLREVGLSGTETQVTKFIMQGLPTRKIAEQLNLSVKTIEFHRNNIRQKLGIKHKKINLRTFLSSYKD